MVPELQKIVVLCVVAVVVLAGGFFWLNDYLAKLGPTDYREVTFFMSGEPVTLVDGVAETETMMGATSKTTVRYFGNEAKGDLNGDGIPDTVFLITQEGGGSGTFFYLVGALQHADNTYEGTQAVLIGDRVAPQTTEFRDGLVVVNYADRAPGEPMSAQPSVGKSLYLKYDPARNDFGEVVQDFEGESSGGGNGILPYTSGVRGVVMLGPTCPVVRDPPDPACADKSYATLIAIYRASDPVHALVITRSNAAGIFTADLPPGEYTVGAGESNLPRCSAENFSVAPDTYTPVAVSCDTGIR